MLPVVSDQRRLTNQGPDGIFMGGDISAGGGLHDETARNLIGSISPLGIHNQNPGFGNQADLMRDDSQELASMWPSSNN